jgi:hypothetical protein
MGALQPAAEVWVNVYTDSKYAFTTIHVPGVRRGASLIQEEKLSRMGKISSNC